MTKLTRQMILDAHDIETVDVAVPEWGGEVTVRGLNGIERDRIEKEQVTYKGKQVIVNNEGMRVKLVAMCCIDENGERLFTMKDVELLGKKNSVALDRIATAVLRLSGLSNDVVKASSLDFTPTQTDGSTSS